MSDFIIRHLDNSVSSAMKFCKPGLKSSEKSHVPGFSSNLTDYDNLTNEKWQSTVEQVVNCCFNNLLRLPSKLQS